MEDKLEEPVMNIFTHFNLCDFSDVLVIKNPLKDKGISFKLNRVMPAGAELSLTVKNVEDLQLLLCEFLEDWDKQRNKK